MNRTVGLSIGLLIVAAVLGAAAYTWYRSDKDTIERTEYNPPKDDNAEVLTDDKLEDKQPVAFDPKLVDRRPIGQEDAWLLNASAAVIRLDVPMIRPDSEANLLTLHPSYAAAIGANSRITSMILPSVNMLDGKAKQFDDGLYAALDQAYYRGLNNTLVSHVKLVRRIYDGVGPDSVAAPFLAAGLQLAGVEVPVAKKQDKDRLLSDFQADQVRSKPIGFYTWNADLTACFRFLRFFQREFGPHQLAVPTAIAAALGRDEALRGDYRKAVGFYAKLTNPLICLSADSLIGLPAGAEARFEQLCREHRVAHHAVALFPPSSSRETVLFEKLFQDGLPPGTDLMRELVRRIRSGEVDLRPSPGSGWYDHQVYALETLLLPGRGEEKDKLLLTKAYKKRMLEAFQALITKRRETHVRQLAIAKSTRGAPTSPPDVKPRLRIEPCPTYYLRTARSYSFLADFLEAAVGKAALQTLHGLKQGGQRKANLHAELLQMRDLFYGFYLVSAEDIGLKPVFAPGEPVEAEPCYQLAMKWLPEAFKDEDLAVDTRVSVPIFSQPGATRLWATLGVRLSKLDASYGKPPSIKPAKGDREWKEVEKRRLGVSQFYIPVDEFAEVELRGNRVLTREELRKVCDREKTKEAILKALR